MTGLTTLWSQLGDVSATTYFLGAFMVLLGIGIVGFSVYFGGKILDPDRDYSGQGIIGGLLVFLFGAVWITASVLDATHAMDHPYLILWGVWFALLVVAGIPAIWTAFRKYKNAW